MMRAADEVSEKHNAVDRELVHVLYARHTATVKIHAVLVMRVSFIPRGIAHGTMMMICWSSHRV